MWGELANVLKEINVIGFFNVGTRNNMKCV